MREESIFLRNTFIIIRFGKYFDKFNPVPLKNENPPCQKARRTTFSLLLLSLFLERSLLPRSRVKFSGENKVAYLSTGGETSGGRAKSSRVRDARYLLLLPCVSTGRHREEEEEEEGKKGSSICLSKLLSFLIVSSFTAVKFEATVRQSNRKFDGFRYGVPFD